MLGKVADASKFVMGPGSLEHPQHHNKRASNKALVLAQLWETVP